MKLHQNYIGQTHERNSLKLLTHRTKALEKSSLFDVFINKAVVTVHEKESLKLFLGVCFTLCYVFCFCLYLGPFLSVFAVICVQPQLIP